MLLTPVVKPLVIDDEEDDDEGPVVPIVSPIDQDEIQKAILALDKWEQEQKGKDSTFKVSLSEEETENNDVTQCGGRPLQCTQRRGIGVLSFLLPQT